MGRRICRATRCSWQESSLHELRQDLISRKRPMACVNKGRKNTINFFDPTQKVKPRTLGPQKKFMCLISWERTQKRDPHKLFRVDFWGQKRGAKEAIFGHKSSVYCFIFFPALSENPLVPCFAREFQGIRSTPNMTGRRFHCRTEAIPRRLLEVQKKALSIPALLKPAYTILAEIITK